MSTIEQTFPPIPGETLPSWVSRVAQRFWVDAATFCLDKNTSFTAVLHNDDTAIERLHDHGIDVPDALRRGSPYALGAGKQSFLKHEFPTRVLLSPTVRGCPACLRDDRNNHAEQMALRGQWLVPHVSICIKHSTPLVTLWREANVIKRYDCAPQLARIAERIQSGELDTNPRKPFDFDHWIADRLRGKQTDATWLDQHSLHAASNFCRYLGAARLRLEDIPLSRIPSEHRPILYEMGFQIARQGKEAVLQTLEELQRKPGSPQDGAKAIFPLLYERLSYDHRDDPNYAPFQDILRQHMMETWPLGPGDDLLGHPVLTRRLHSVRTASQSCGIDQRRLRKTLAAKQIVPAAEHGLPDAWEVFDATKAAPVLAELTQLVSAKEMAATIHASRSQFDLLVADGVLKPVLQTQGVKAVWNPAHGQAFLDRVLRGARQLRQAQHGWEHISKAAQRLKTGPGEIIAVIDAGLITRVGNKMGAEGYAAFYVYHDDVAAILRPPPPNAKSIEVFSKSLGINQPSYLKRMIDDGHVVTTTLQNPTTKARQVYFTPEDEIAFHERFLTPKTMAETFGEPWQKLLYQLRNLSVTPFSPDAQRYGNVYLRAEVEKALK